MSATINGVRTVDLPNLGAVTDNSLVVGDHAGTGSFQATALRSYVNRSNDVSVLDYGALGNGTTDDTAAIQAALNHCGSGAAIKGGTVTMPSGYSFKAGNLTIPAGVTLRGPLGVAGAPGMANFSPPYGALSSLELTAGATITMNGGSGLEGLLIIPSGMVFQQDTPGQPATWTGTAITAAGDDVAVRGCLVMGFRLAFTATSMSRVRITDCNLDCWGGILINSATDICYIYNVHCWPFGSISQANTADLTRGGVAFAFQHCAADVKVIGCFAYGYLVGYQLTDSGMTLIGCAADNTATGYGTGFSLVGVTTLIMLAECLASGSNNGFYINSTAAGGIINLVNCRGFGLANAGIVIDTGDTANVSIRGGVMSTAPYGIAVQTAAPVVTIDGVNFNAMATKPILMSVAGSNVSIGDGCTYGSLAAGQSAVGTNLTIPSIASAEPLAIPPNAVVLTVTGTTNFSDINQGWAGRELTLMFAGVLTIANNTGGANTKVRLNGGVNFTTAAGSSLSIKHNGVQWYETGRCV